MPVQREKYVPQHRRATAPPAGASARRQVLRSAALLTSVAAVVTGGIVGSGVASSVPSGPETISNVAQDVGWDAARPASGPARAERSALVSRSDRREAADPARKARPARADRPAVSRKARPAVRDPRSIARMLIGEFGFSADQFACLDALWVSESDWRVDADNPTSSAYGIPQALTELHELPADYMVSAEAQIRWGLSYIKDSYGSPCSAWSFKQANNWY